MCEDDKCVTVLKDVLVNLMLVLMLCDGIKDVTVLKKLLVNILMLALLMVSNGNKRIVNFDTNRRPHHAYGDADQNK